MILDCRVFGTILDDTPKSLADELHFEFNYLGRMFLFCRPPVSLPGLPTLNFAFHTGNEGPMVVKESVFPSKRCKGGLCIIGYNAERHRNLTKEERYTNLIELMREGIKPYVSHLGLDTSCFEKAFTRMRAVGFKGRSFLLDPVKTSKDRKHKATLEVELFENKHLFNIAFLDKEGRVLKRVLTRLLEIPQPVDNLTTLCTQIGRWRWLSNEDFVLSTRSAGQNWIASPNRDGCEFKQGRGYNKEYSPWSPPTRIVVWDKYWRLKGIE